MRSEQRAESVGEAEARAGITMTASGQGPQLTLTVQNVVDKHLLIDNSLSFDGFHWNYPRQI